MIHIDPRTKLGLLISVVVFSAFSNSAWMECAAITVIMITGILLGRVGRTIGSAVVFYLLWIFARYGLPYMGGVLQASLAAWFILMFKCYPCCMLGGVIIGTTHISEFMAAMSRMKIPKTIVIPLAIMCRYFPVVKEDWGYIKDAMSMRGLTPTPLSFIRNPSGVIDALYVPMLISASKTADELSVAAVTRGIENPKPRTSHMKIRFGIWDILFVLAYIGLAAAGVLVK